MIDRLVEKMDLVDPAGCWRWTAATNAAGYGTVLVGRNARLAHRVVWENAVGPIPEDCELHHICETPACVNPDHLEPLTRTQHRAQHVKYQTLKTHCPQGHPYDEANTRHYRGRRKCRQCGRDYMRRKRAQP